MGSRRHQARYGYRQRACILHSSMMSWLYCVVMGLWAGERLLAQFSGMQRARKKGCCCCSSSWRGTGTHAVCAPPRVARRAHHCPRTIKSDLKCLAGLPSPNNFSSSTDHSPVSHPPSTTQRPHLKNGALDLHCSCYGARSKLSLHPGGRCEGGVQYHLLLCVPCARCDTGSSAEPGAD